jgi:hypothetical protein
MLEATNIMHLKITMHPFQSHLFVVIVVTFETVVNCGS